MRFLLKSFVFNALSFYLISSLFGGIKYPTIGILMYASVIFSLLNIFVKPIIKLLTFPINLVTFGFFSSLINVLILFSLTQIVPDFRVVPFSINSYNIFGFQTPEFSLTIFWAYFVVSAVLGLLSVVFWSFLG
jgi:putative membrane protein